MVAADAFRAGAIEQLRIYAQIIGAPFRIARTPEELDAALTGGRQTLLVDTAGRSPSDPVVRDTLRMLGRRRGVRTHLVMAADTSAATARRVFDAYHDAHPDRLVITKLDEAETLSPLIPVLNERQIPISYFTAGQRVPEDLDRATPQLLAAAVLRERQSPYARVS
jgi:flagellar biosynthesis protein FlhF